MPTHVLPDALAASEVFNHLCQPHLGLSCHFSPMSSALSLLSLSLEGLHVQSHEQWLA